jgi:hypothetical protein
MSPRCAGAVAPISELAPDYEFRVQKSEAMIDLPAIRRMLNRIVLIQNFLDTL